MSEEKKILRDLVVDKQDIIANLAELVGKVKDVFVIENETGKVIFKNFSKLKNHKKIYALLLAKHFAKKLEFIEDDSMSISQISNELKIADTTLSVPLQKVVKNGYVLKDDSKYSINYHRIEEVVADYFK